MCSIITMNYSYPFSPCSQRGKISRASLPAAEDMSSLVLSSTKKSN